MYLPMMYLISTYIFISSMYLANCTKKACSPYHRKLLTDSSAHSLTVATPTPPLAAGNGGGGPIITSTGGGVSTHIPLAI